MRPRLPPRLTRNVNSVRATQFRQWATQVLRDFAIRRQVELPNGMRRGRIDLDACVEIGGTQAAYAICGSVDFVRSMWRGLVDRGLDGGSISTETFFE